MSKLLIRGAWCESVLFYTGKNGQRTAEIQMRADWSDVVCAEMKWADKPEGFGKSPVGGPLYASNMILEPNKAALKDYRVDLPVSKVSDFKYVPKLDGEGNVSEAHLHFLVTTIADDAVVVMDNWVKHVMETDKSQCRIQYDAEKQQELPIEPAEEKPRGRRKTTEAVQ